MVGYVEINQNSACMAFEWTMKNKKCINFCILRGKWPPSGNYAWKTVGLTFKFSNIFILHAHEFFSFSNSDGDGNENVEKTIALFSEAITLHVPHILLHVSLQSPHNCHLKMPIISRFLEDAISKEATTNFSASFSRIQLRGNSIKLAFI